MNTIKKTPITIGSRIPQPVSKFTVTRALAAAGGCIVFVKDIMIKTMTKVMVKMKRLLPKMLQIVRPASTERRCPPIICRGCDNGPLWATNTRTHVAPSGPITIGY